MTDLALVEEAGLAVAPHGAHRDVAPGGGLKDAGGRAGIYGESAV